ncbi:MAG: hypothetical protein AAGB30_11230 [Pedobacter sp.]|nr:hypothetical protein [Pedobacter sp.]
MKSNIINNLNYKSKNIMLERLYLDELYKNKVLNDQIKELKSKLRIKK